MSRVSWRSGTEAKDEPDELEETTRLGSPTTPEQDGIGHGIRGLDREDHLGLSREAFRKLALEHLRSEIWPLPRSPARWYFARFHLRVWWVDGRLSRTPYRPTVIAVMNVTNQYMLSVIPLKGPNPPVPSVEVTLTPSRTEQQPLSPPHPTPPTLNPRRRTRSGSSCGPCSQTTLAIEANTTPKAPALAK